MLSLLPLVATTAFSMFSSIQKGKAAKSAANSEARQMEANAARARQSGKTRAEEEKRQTARLMSDAQAVQGASGFSASDAQALSQVGDIAGAGKYNELSYLYESEMDAIATLRGAKHVRKAGAAAKRSAYIGAAATAFSAASLYKSPLTSGSSFGPYKSGYRANPGFPQASVAGQLAPRTPFRMKGVPR